MGIRREGPFKQLPVKFWLGHMQLESGCVKNILEFSPILFSTPERLMVATIQGFSRRQTIFPQYEA